jgi:hypothetical protein
MKIKHSLGAAALAFEGETFEADEQGYIDAPFELAQLLLNQPEWSADEPQAVGTTDPHSALYEAGPTEVEAEAESEPVNPFAAALAEAEATPAEERSPYQKGLLTRAANEAAAKAAEAEAK